MAQWKVLGKVSYVEGNITVNIDLSEYPHRFKCAQQRLGEMVLESCKPFMPFLTGSLQQRSTVDNGGREVVFPGPYGRYQYGGRVMVDSVTGKGPAMIHDKYGMEVGLRFRKGAVLVATDRPLTYTRQGAQAEWFQPAKDKDMQMWIGECEKIIKGEK